MSSALVAAAVFEGFSGPRATTEPVDGRVHNLDTTRLGSRRESSPLAADTTRASWS